MKVFPPPEGTVFMVLHRGRRQLKILPPRACQGRNGSPTFRSFPWAERERENPEIAVWSSSWREERNGHFSCLCLLLPGGRTSLHICPSRWVGYHHGPSPWWDSSSRSHSLPQARDRHRNPSPGGTIETGTFIPLGGTGLEIYPSPEKAVKQTHPSPEKAVKQTHPSP